MRIRGLLMMSLFIVSMVWGEEELSRVGALPPIGNSLNAPIQIDEGNMLAQEQFLASSAQRATELLKTKRFPIEIILATIGIAFAVMIGKRLKPVPKIVEKPPLTDTERYQFAREILSEADEELTDEEALSLFALLDPIAHMLASQEKYASIAEQVKFAGVSLKREDLQQLLNTQTD